MLPTHYYSMPCILIVDDDDHEDVVTWFYILFLYCPASELSVAVYFNGMELSKVLHRAWHSYQCSENDEILHNNNSSTTQVTEIAIC